MEPRKCRVSTERPKVAWLIFQAG